MKQKIIYVSVVLAVMIPVIFNTWGLTESSEARYAEMSREMYLSGDYINPSLLGIKHFHKPPVTYYLTAFSYSIFGVSEFSARFFLAISLLIQVLLVYKITALLTGKDKTAVLAMLIYFSFPIAQIAAKNLTTDSYLTTFIFASVYFFLAYRVGNKHVRNIYLFYIFCALAFLTKGPVGVLPQAVFALVFVRVTKNKRSFQVHHILALILGILLSASWFIVLLIHNPEMLNYFVNHQLVDRVATNSFSREKPFWYYFAFMPLVGLPAILLTASMYKKVGVRFAERKIQTVCIVSFLICLVVFSLSASKLILYVLPLYLFIAIVIAIRLQEMSERGLNMYTNIAAAFYVIILVGLFVAVFVSSKFSFPLVKTIAIAVVGCICVLLIKFRLRASEQLRAAIVSAVGVFFLMIFMPVFMQANELQVNSIKPLAEKMQAIKPTSRGKIVVYNYLLPSLEFYTGQRPVTIDNGSNTSSRETQFETDSSLLKKYYLQVVNDSVRVRNLSNNEINFVVALKSSPVPDSLSFLLQNLPHSDTTGKWIIYY